MNYEYGIQMCSVRDLAEVDLAAAVKAVGELGYSYVEFAGYFGHTAEEICKMMKDANVTLRSVHDNWRDLSADKIDKTIEFQKAIGNKNLLNKVNRFCEKSLIKNLHS